MKGKKEDLQSHPGIEKRSSHGSKHRFVHLDIHHGISSQHLTWTASLHANHFEEQSQELGAGGLAGDLQTLPNLSLHQSRNSKGSTGSGVPLTALRRGKSVSALMIYGLRSSGISDTCSTCQLCARSPFLSPTSKEKDTKAKLRFRKQPSSKCIF